MIKIPYVSAVGSLMYAMVGTRTDITYVIRVVSRFMSIPGREHWVVVKWILPYMKGTSSVCLQFGLGKPLVEGFTNSNMSAYVDTSRSTSDYVMTYTGGAVSWQTRQPNSVALSTTEVEYMAVVEAYKEVIWMKDFIGEKGIKHEEFRLHCDNKVSSTLRRTQPTTPGPSTEENGSDMLTKVLSTEKLDVCRRRIEMASNPMPE